MIKNTSERRTAPTSDPLNQYFVDRGYSVPSEKERRAQLDEVAKAVSLPPEPSQDQKLQAQADSLIYTYGSRPNRRHTKRNILLAAAATGVAAVTHVVSGGNGSPSPETPPAVTAKAGDANYVVPEGSSLWDVAGLVDKAQDGIAGNQDRRPIVADLAKELGTDKLEAGQHIVVHGVHDQDQDPTQAGIQITPPEAK